MKFLGWNVPPEELPNIPEYWLTQKEPEPHMHYLLAVLYIGFMFASVIGNGLVLWIFAGFEISYDDHAHCVLVYHAGIRSQILF